MRPSPSALLVIMVIDAQVEISSRQEDVKSKVVGFVRVVSGRGYSL